MTDFIDHRAKASSTPADGAKLFGIIALLVDQVDLIKDLLSLLQTDSVLSFDRSGFFRSNSNRRSIYNSYTIRAAALNRKLPSLRLNRNPPQFGEFSHARLSAEAPIPTRLYPAKRHLRLVVDRRAVDMADTGLDPSGHC